jgi:hypothetical protein
MGDCDFGGGEIVVERNGAVTTRGTLIVGGTGDVLLTWYEPRGGALAGFGLGVTELKNVSKSSLTGLASVLLVCKLATPRACGAASVGAGKVAKDDAALTGISGVSDRVLNVLT